MSIPTFFHQQYDMTAEGGKMTCPSCHKNSLEFQEENPQKWQCWSCKKGGVHLQLAELIFNSLPMIGRKAGTELSKKKPPIPPAFWRKLDIRQHGEWLYWPVRTPKGDTPAAYYKFNYTHDKPTPLSSPKPMSHTLLGTEHLEDHHKTLILCEGHWDYACWQYSSSSSEHYGEKAMGQEVAVIATAGSSVSKKSLGVFKGKRVICVFDHDEAGQAGVEHLARNLKMAQCLPSSLEYLDWTSAAESFGLNLEPGYDLRDMMQELK